MRRTFSALLAIASFVGVARAAAPEHQLERLVAELEVEAKRRMDGQPVNPVIERKLKALAYDAASLKTLQRTLAKRDPDAVSVFMAYRLLRPLLNAKQEVIAKALPAAKALRNKFSCYKKPPTYTREQLARLKTPGGNPDSAEAMRQRAVVEKRREEKLARDRAAAFHNAQVAELDRVCMHLMILSGETAADRELHRLVTKSEEENHWLWYEVLDLLRRESKFISKERAEYWYDELKKWGLEVHLKKDRYLDRGEVKIDPDGNSRFERPVAYTGRQILTTANFVATTARKPAIKVPSRKQIDRHHRRRR